MAVKKIGTFVPLSALRSEKTQTTGTIADGITFLDWLEKNHQQAWQMLPLSQTHMVSHNTHAASPYRGYGIGLDPKIWTNLDIANANDSHLDMPWVIDYGLFCALRDHFGTDDWTSWSEGLRIRNPDVLDVWKQKLQRQIAEHVVMQRELRRQFARLRQIAGEKQITLIGDLPYYIPLASPLTWMYQDCFFLDENSKPLRVSGLPDDKNAMYGRQVWGHPLYKWEETSLHPRIVELFTLRLAALTPLFAMVRLDHANGFYEYGSMDVSNAEHDTLLPGPGRHIFEKIVAACRAHNLAVFAEDAAIDTTRLRRTMNRLQVPGIKILRYAADKKYVAEYAKTETYPNHVIAYTTTHDTEPLMGWLLALSKEKRKYVAQKLRITYGETKDMARQLVQKVIDSPAEIAIIPIQDWLFLPDRINTPGTEKLQNDPNWQFVLPKPIEEL